MHTYTILSDYVTTGLFKTLDGFIFEMAFITYLDINYVLIVYLLVVVIT